MRKRAIFGSGINIGNLHSQLDELPMPYKFDVICYDDIAHAPLREHIDRVGVEIYANNKDYADHIAVRRREPQ